MTGFFSGRRPPKFLALLVVFILAGATLAIAAEGGHHGDSGAVLKDFIWRCLNFAVTFGLLAYFVTKPIRKGLTGRREEVAKTLEQAEKAQAEAEAKFAEYDAKLSRAGAEIEEIYAHLQAEGKKERERILAEAELTAVKIKEEARKAADHEIGKAQTALQKEAVRLAVKIAEDLLKQKISSDDQERLVNEYTEKVGELH